jgi:hypothetical protein
MPWQVRGSSLLAFSHSVGLPGVVSETRPSLAAQIIRLLTTPLDPIRIGTTRCIDMPVSSVTSNPHALRASGLHVRFRFEPPIYTPLGA